MLSSAERVVHVIAVRKAAATLIDTIDTKHIGNYATYAVHVVPAIRALLETIEKGDVHDSDD